ncbi:hypothetical protein ABNX05_11100 [Lysinibacillus sp. M3]|uniref:Uncharacterized protein n=1 Tax=Lysinibacillus zambalensis TaxID=3160866 RepID=A0ABV1MRN0_9BACI
MDKTSNPLIFIYQFGFKQISLPPTKAGMNNFDVINIASCEDGHLIKTKEPIEESYLKLKEMIGKEVVSIYCDTNDITSLGILKSCVMTKDDFDSDVISVWY